MHTNGTVFVTGGASGIGLAIVRALLDEGWRVIVADLVQGNLDQARRTSSGATPAGLASSSSTSRTRRAVEPRDRPVRCGVRAPDGLVNSAGIGADVPCLETSTGLFRKILEVNLIGSFVARARPPSACGRAAADRSSTSLRYPGIRGNAGRVAYGASKGGVIIDAVTADGRNFPAASGLSPPGGNIQQGR